MSADGETAAALGLLEARAAATGASRAAPGLSIAVVRGEEAVWARGFGHADVEIEAPAAPDPVDGVGSITCQVQLSPADRLGVAVFTNGSGGAVGSALADWALDLLVGVSRGAAARRPVAPPQPVGARGNVAQMRYNGSSRQPPCGRACRAAGVRRGRPGRRALGEGVPCSRRESASSAP